MAIKGAVRTDAIAATETGKLINFISVLDYENGFVFHAEDLHSGERNAFIASTPTTASITTKSVYLHASPEVTYAAGETIVNFYLAAGEVGRGYLLEQGDVNTTTNAVIDGTPLVGSYLIPQNNSNKLIVTTSLSGGTKFVAKIIELDTIYGQAATVYRVVSN